MTIQLLARRQDLPLTNWDWQEFISTRLEPWPAAQVNVATVGKVRGADIYHIIPALRFSQTIGHDCRFENMRAVRKYLRQAVESAESDNA